MAERFIDGTAAQSRPSGSWPKGSSDGGADRAESFECAHKQGANPLWTKLGYAASAMWMGRALRPGS